MFGKMMNKNLGYIHFWVTAISAYGVFFPMHFIGMAGLPRRYYSNTNFPLFDDLADTNQIITMFAILGASVQLVFLYNFIYSMFYGKSSTKSWKSTTLEWTAHKNRFMVIGKVKFPKSIDGHMTTVSQDIKKILYPNTMPLKRVKKSTRLIIFSLSIDLLLPGRELFY
ncbi:MAG: hypothetical protein CM15mP129_01980 [Chloroflexota bacterium]|nr:MAG: hypothetical protein CM15mP129_01980 [Chloroflexota bacterium]